MTALRLVDAVAIVTALVAAHLVGARAGFAVPDQTQLLLPLGFALAWLGGLILERAYEFRFLGLGHEEYRRVTVASLEVFAFATIGFYVLDLDVARGYVALALPIGLALLLLGRFCVRRLIQRARAQGRVDHRVMVVGEPSSSVRLTQVLERNPMAGLHVVGTLSPVPERPAEPGTIAVSPLERVAEEAQRLRADMVAVAASEQVTDTELKRVAWSLEGQDVDLVVVPSLIDVAGPRIQVRPVAGVPLMYVDQPRLSRVAMLTKHLIDKAAALVGLLLLGPLLLLVAATIQVSSHGPALYRQRRVGLHGQEFEVLKFRTMHCDAHERQADFEALNRADGPLFKLERDPRVTRVGRWLRRTSIDELPQLINVLRGEMSLVGPRPFALDVADYAEHEYRRHLVRPGITGLWQVSGRESQSWQEAVRLDLYYVENWSLALDFLVLARTIPAAFRGD